VIKLNLKSYPHYKDSGISWIGEIPGHWRTNKLKTYFFIVNGSTPKDFEENWGGDICWITPADYKTSDVYINSSSRHITKKGLNSCGTTIVPAGSIIVSNRAPIGTVAIANKELCTNQGCKSLTVKRDINTKFVYYILSINEEELNKLGRGTTFMELSSQDLGTFGIPIATLVEQEHIVKFLDKKTTKIEENIAKNQELIKLLEEKRTALINQVVTKGLNPDVPMKDSGVEWIGEIPEHWDINNLNYAASDDNYSFVDGPFGSDLKNEEYVDEGIPIIQLNNIKVGFHDFSNERFITEEKYNQLKKHSIKPGHIVIAKMAEPVARGTIVSDKYEKYTIVADCIKLACNNKFSNRYVTYSLNSYIYHEAVQKATGTTRVRINLQEMKKLKLLIPPLEEQKEISDYLDIKISNINYTITKIKENINLLDEYKTSLIHHVVTGKIKVSD